LHRRVYCIGRASWKAAMDGFSLLRGGSIFSPLAAMYESLFDWQPLPAHRTFITGTELPYPESRSVPLADADFDSEAQRAAIMNPWRVSDPRGEVLPMWKKTEATQPSPIELNRPSKVDAALSLTIR